MMADRKLAEIERLNHFTECLDIVEELILERLGREEVEKITPVLDEIRAAIKEKRVETLFWELGL